MQKHKQLTKANKEQDPFVLYTYFVNDDVTTSTVDHGFEGRTWVRAPIRSNQRI